jgi:hypothetical protein
MTRTAQETKKLRKGLKRHRQQGESISLITKVRRNTQTDSKEKFGMYVQTDE